MACPSFTNSSGSELKTSSVLIIYAALPRYFFSFLSVEFVGGLIRGVAVAIFHGISLGEGLPVVGLRVG